MPCQGSRELHRSFRGARMALRLGTDEALKRTRVSELIGGRYLHGKMDGEASSKAFTSVSAQDIELC